MMTAGSATVDTAVGRLHVEVDGEGPPAVLWHSLFVDNRVWAPLRARLRRHRRLIVIDGPGHGKSGAPPSLFTLDDCAAAALRVLDSLEVAEPVDWLGSAWGGHVGLTMAAGHRERLRSLTTIATPVQALTRLERLKIAPMVAAYRAVGASPPLVAALAQMLLGKTFVRTRSEDTATIMRAIREAPKSGMHRAMKSAMLRRPSLQPLLPGIVTPTVMIVPTNDPVVPVDQIRTAVAQMPTAVAVTVDGEGHVAPLFAQADELAAIIIEFWDDPARFVAGRC
jgi:pimeloyl-ACP methyl ester carboxylesterase